MSELIFDVTIDEDNRYVAIARDNGIATDGADWEEMKANVRELIEAYYFDSPKPNSVQFLQQEFLAVA
jgi:predicted RNase H-like HicB family nuclease